MWLQASSMQSPGNSLETQILGLSLSDVKRGGWGLRYLLYSPPLVLMTLKFDNFSFRHLITSILGRGERHPVVTQKTGGGGSP